MRLSSWITTFTDMKIKTKLSFISLILALTVLLTLTVTPAFASPVANPKKLPRLVTMSFYGVDGTQMAFNWNTTDFTDSDVLAVEASDEQGFNSPNVISASGTVEVSKASKSDGYIHRCVLTGLKLGTKYLYKVGDKELNAFSETGSFTTESGKADKFTFIHLSDPQADSEHYYDIYKGVLQSAVNNCSPAFFVNTGDIVNNNWLGYNPNLDQWEWSLTKVFDITKDYPQVATAGNHEAADYDFSSRFNFPTPAGADTKSGVYYSFNYNGVHFIGLNTNDTTNPKSANATGLSDEQLNWLKSDLEANKDVKWKVVMMHKGIYDGGDGANNTLDTDFDVQIIRRQVAPLFSQYGVDLVLQGHDHLYSKSFPISATLDGQGNLIEQAATTAKYKYTYDGQEYEVYSQPNGPVYINSGSASGWKLFQPVPYDATLIDKVEKGEVMYTAITIDGDDLIVETYTIDGNYASVPYHSFGITKNKLDGDPISGDNNGNHGNNGNDKPTDPTAQSLPAWAIALIVVGSVIVAGGIAAAVILIVKKHKKTNN